MQMGFPEKSANVRLAQYETGRRTPKADLAAVFGDTLDVSPRALAVPEIDSYIGLMYTLFTLEDKYGLHIDEVGDDVYLKADVRKNEDAARLHEMLCAWRQTAAMHKTGEITQEGYDCWRYAIPNLSLPASGIRIHRCRNIVI